MIRLLECKYAVNLPKGNKEGTIYVCKNPKGGDYLIIFGFNQKQFIEELIKVIEET